MREVVGNLWDYYEKATIVITTNGSLKKSGECVMGKGCAFEAKKKFPWVAKVLGTLIIEGGNKVFYLGDGLVSFPVKHNWWEKADLELIERSSIELVNLTNHYKWKTVVVPRPGCGNGGLEWNEVKPILKRYLDDKFLVITRE